MLVLVLVTVRADGVTFEVTLVVVLSCLMAVAGVTILVVVAAREDYLVRVRSERGDFVCTVVGGGHSHSLRSCS